MDLTFGVLALLPLGLFSLFGKHRRSDAGFGFLAALAPAIFSGIKSIVSHKQQSSKEKKAAEYEKQQAAAEEAARKTAWDAQQNSPQANLQRMSFNMQLGRLLGGVGGRDKAPPSLVKALDAARGPQTYVPGTGYTPKPSSGAGIWDVIGGATDALAYLDPSAIKSKPKTTTPPIYGNTPQSSTFSNEPIDTSLNGSLLSTLKRKPINFTDQG
jgi:hypothetical protein